MDCERLEVDVSQSEYEVCYCVKYKPVWSSERILARWWRNDRGERTEHWTFNDWKI